LFPIDWPEPFGLVMIEAMACGTPVLAFRHGSVPEIIEDNVTGRIVSSIEEAPLALPEVIALDRRTVRRRFEERFTAARMAKDYVRVYRALLERRSTELVEAPTLTPFVPPPPSQARLMGGVES
jgi:glycosyltransferase involved in cell wall biosynthesis